MYSLKTAPEKFTAFITLKLKMTNHTYEEYDFLVISDEKKTQ